MAAKFNLIHTNFTAGELSPRMVGRVDVARYNNGAKTLENVLVLIHGGAMRRPGKLFVAPARYAAKQSRLIPYVFSVDQAYQLEFGEGYVRFFDDDGAVITETPVVVSGVTQANPAAVTAVAHGYATGNTVYLDGVGGMAQINGGPYVITVTGANTFTLNGINSTSFGAYTAGGSSERVYEIANPYTEAQLHEVDFVQRADTLFLFHGDIPTQRLQRFANANWRLQPAPWITEPFDELGERPNTTLTLASLGVGAGVNVTSGAAAFMAGDVGRTIEAGGGLATITGYTSTTQVTVTITSAFPSLTFIASAWLLNQSPQVTCTPSGVGTIGSTITLTLSAAGWRPGDVGKHVVIDGGLVKLTTITSDVLADGEVRVVLDAAIAAEASSWALCRSMWGAEFGYPRTGSIHQQRLHLAGSPGFPQDGWFSRLAEYYDFEISTDADSAYNYRIDSDQANPIRHLASIRALVALTYGGEFTLSGGGDPITPTTLDIQNQSAFGCGVPAPVRIGNELLVVCPSIDEETGLTRDEIRAMSADRFDSSNYAAPDVSALAEHVTAGGIVDMDAQKNMLWAVRADGQMVTLRLDRDNDVVASSRQITDGSYESVSVIPRPSGARDVWAIVRRSIGGNDVRYVERFVAGVFMDSAVRGTTGVATATWGGGKHLIGKTVAVRADGVLQADAVVDANGEITLARTALAVEFGLPFVPKVELMTAEVQGPAGSVQGLMMRTPEVTLLVKDTVGASVNGKPVQFRQFGPDVLDLPIEPFSGQKRVELLGLGERGKSDIVITQPQAAPFHLLAVIRQFSVST